MSATVFYPEHPSPEKTHQIATSLMPAMEQEIPFAVKVFREEFSADEKAFYEKYADKRFEVWGFITQMGLDSHNMPSVKLSDRANGQTCALCIFPSEDCYAGMRIGETAIIRGNYLVMSDRHGVILKNCEITKGK